MRTQEPLNQPLENIKGNDTKRTKESLLPGDGKPKTVELPRLHEPPRHQDTKKGLLPGDCKPKTIWGGRQLLILILFTLAGHLWGAVGCDLNDPDRDVKRLFPDSTGYKTFYKSIRESGGDPLLKRVEARLGDPFKGLYETAENPYTVYEIHKGKAVAGYIHGVNQKGEYGGIQVFLSLTKEGTITAFYIQKLTSEGASKFRAPAFGKQFVGLSLKEFSHYDVATGKFTGLKDPPLLKDPAGKGDFKAILRAVKKNLILMDEFIYRPGPAGHPKGN